MLYWLPYLINYFISFRCRELMKMKPVRLHLMLAVSLALAIVVFLVMEWFTESDATIKASPACTTVSVANQHWMRARKCSCFKLSFELNSIYHPQVAFLLNYLWLCQLAWMVIEAVAMYVALVQVFGGYTSQYKFNVAGWGLPLIFPIIGLAWGQGDYADSKT